MVEKTATSTVREISFAEMWEEINKFYLMVQMAAFSGKLMKTPHEFLTAVRTANHHHIGDAIFESFLTIHPIEGTLLLCGVRWTGAGQIGPLVRNLSATRSTT